MSTRWLSKGAAAVATAVLAFAPLSARAQQVVIEAKMAQPVALAGPAQKAYLRVALRGIRPTQTSVRTPANVAIVLDKSGSMTGQKIAHAIQAAIKAVSMLGPDDIVSIITYDDTVHVLVPATKLDDRAYIYSQIERIQANGSTALFAGVSKGAAEVRKFIDKNRVNRVVLLSDGLANVGPSSPGDLAELGTSLGREGIAVTTIGLGLDFNEDLMTKLAQASDGNHSFAEQPQDLERIFANEFGDVLSVVAQDVNIVIDCADGIRPIRVLGRDATIVNGRIVTSMNQLYGDQEKYVFVEVELPGSAAGDGAKLDVATAQVTYNDSITRRSTTATARAGVVLSSSTQTVEQRTNPVVMASVVEQIAVDNNRQALELRDAGRIEEARSALLSNEAYLSDNASKLNSEVLREYAVDNRAQAVKVGDEQEWKTQRKVMRDQQFKKSNQVQNKSSSSPR